MGDMQPWLEDRIASKLVQANAWLHQRSSNTTQAFENDGSSVHIIDEIHNDSACLRVVQRDPLVLSDGAASIQAEVAHPHLRFLTPGFTFALTKYSIRYTPYGPPSDRLAFTLLALEFRKEPHNHPISNSKPIVECNTVADALRTLRQTRAHLDRQCFGRVEIKREETDNMANTRDYRAEDEGDGGGSFNTQTAFGTQMIHQVRTPNKNTERQAEFTRTNIDSQRQDLLGLLNKRKGQENSAAQINVLASAGPSPSPRAIPQAPTNRRFPNQADGDDNDVPQCDESKPSSAGGFTKASTNGTVSDRIERPTDRVQPARMPPRYPRGDAPEENPRAAGLEKQTTTQGLKNASIGFSPSQADEDVLEDTEPEWLKDTCRLDACGKVPEKQQKLLSRPESWQKHRSGTDNRFPQANVPIDVLTALKNFEMNASSSESEPSDDDDVSPSFPAHSQKGESENEDISDEDEGNISWSSSPAAESPKQRFRPGPSLPPDSSLSDKGNRDEIWPQESSSDQEAQRVGGIASSNEELMINPPSSPPMVLHDDNSDMELDIPRGLKENKSIHKEDSGLRAVRPALTVQVKETPYVKGKDLVTASFAESPASAQRQASSGTPKDSSSTSVVYSTYKEPTSSQKGNTFNPPSSSRCAPVFDEEDDEAIQPHETDSPRRSVRDAPSPQIAHEDVQMEDAQHESPQRQPNAVPTKRKFAISPSKVNRRPKQKLKIMDFGDPSQEDIVEKLRQEKEGSLEKFREKALNRSMEGKTWDNNTKSGAQSVQNVVLKKEVSSAERSPIDIQAFEDADARSPGREDHPPGAPEIPEDIDMEVENPVPTVEPTRVNTISIDNNGSGNTRSAQIGETESENSNIENELLDNATRGHNAPRGQQISSQYPTPEPKASALKRESSTTQPHQPVTIFEKFKATYPAYTGDARHFLNQCKTMKRLDQEDRMVPKWQWDDYLIRKTEWKQYVNQCIDDEEPHEPDYHRFYKDHIQDTLYKQGVIGSKRLLEAAISELEGRTATKSSSAAPPSGLATADQPAAEPPASEVEAPSRTPSVSSTPKTHPPRLEHSTARKRQSLPSAFTKAERTPLAVPKRADNRPRKSPPTGSSSTALPSVSPSQPTKPPPSSKPPSRLPTSETASTRPPSHRRTSGPGIPTEPTGDPFRDHAIALNRTTSFTGSIKVDPRLRWPANLRVRPVAEVRRDGYDVLEWGDGL